MPPPTILLVEDEPNDVFFFEHALKKAGIIHPLQVAKDGQEALDYLTGMGPFGDRQTYPLPGLVLLDLKLPRVTGFEVLQQIRQEAGLRKLIVVVLTSSASDDDVSRAYDLGANAYLVKPSDSSRLAQIVQSIHDFWLAKNRPPTIL